MPPRATPTRGATLHPSRAVRSMRVAVTVAVALTLLLAACGPGETVGDRSSTPAAGDGDTETATSSAAFSPAPDVPDGPLAAADAAALDDVVDETGGIDLDDVATLGASDDARLLWVLSDLLRFAGSQAGFDATVAAAESLSGLDLTGDAVVARGEHPWKRLTDHLMTWDLPAPPDYVPFKARLFTALEPGWTPFFADAQADVDWRLVSWGGVRIDDRPLGDTQTCPDGCIPGLDDPAVTDAAGGDWYPDDRIVFGVVVDDEARAYPKHQMEIHELVNDTVGGLRLGIPYCTLCGAAQAWVTDGRAADGGDLVLRTSGLLSRSNKIMFDLATSSVFDTFRGTGLTGELRGVQLEQVTVVVATWGEWKLAHPDTTIVAEDGGLGRTYPLDPLGGRDDDGPIFPIGAVDDALAVQESVLGVQLEDGTALAFPVDAASAALAAGDDVTLEGITLRPDGGGLRAFDADGVEVPAFQAFWFAWSQRNPSTLRWTP